MPSSRAALQALPGVGRKTANVVLNMWWHLPAQAVDTHIFRVGNRTGIAPGKDPEQVERAIEDNVPAEFQGHAHHWLILHGRYICTARKPTLRRLPDPRSLRIRGQDPMKQFPGRRHRQRHGRRVSHATEEAFLAAHGVQKGIMQLIDMARAVELYGRIGPAEEVSGGSAANTIAGVAQLGGRTAYVGKVKDDQLGAIFAHDLRAQGAVYETPLAHRDAAQETGRCMVLVTPDGERSMNTYLGWSRASWRPRTSTRRRWPRPSGSSSKATASTGPTATRPSPRPSPPPRPAAAGSR